MNGATPYFKSTGINSNNPVFLRLTKITRKGSKNLGVYPNAGTINNPNSEVDYLSSNNRTWSIEGNLPLVSGVIYNEGLGALSDGINPELSLSGLAILEVTGSPMYFYDEIMCNRMEMVNGVGTLKTTKVKVVIKNIEFARNTDYVSAGHEVGYILPYRINLVEDK